MKKLIFVGMCFISQLVLSTQITVDSNQFNEGNNGNCSLAEAVLSASFDISFDQCIAGSGDDEILFESNLFDNVLNTMTVNMNDTMLVLNDNLQITVPEGKNLQLLADASKPHFSFSMNASSSFTLNNTILHNGQSSAAGGAMQFNGNVRFINLDKVFFSNNHADTSGGAIGFNRSESNTNPVTLNITDSYFQNNQSQEFGGAIYASDYVELNISNSEFINNSTSTTGGAVYSSENVLIDTTVFDNNSAELGGGFYSKGGVVEITNSVFQNNMALTNGGGLLKVNGFGFVTTEDLIFKRNSVLNNTAENSAGMSLQNINLIAENNLIALNTASIGVGGLKLNLADADDGVHFVSLIGNTFYHNISNGNSINAVADLDVYFSSGLTKYIGNAIISETQVNPIDLCKINRSASINSAHNLSSDSSDCLVGNNNQLFTSANVRFDAVTGLHPYKVIPNVSSPLIDAWPRDVCVDQDSNHLGFDLNNVRSEGGIFSIFNGDGEGSGQCDIGSTEVANASLINVNSFGTGFGRISSNSEAAIYCPGGACTQAVSIGEEVTLTAQEFTGSEFLGWAGDFCHGSLNDCVFTVPTNQVFVDAEFRTIPTYTLDVITQGNGLGTVSSDIGNIFCGGLCQESYTQNTMVTLTATEDDNMQFAGWSGDCSGLQINCVLDMNADKQVTALFIESRYLMDVLVSLGGKVISLDGNIDCPSECSQEYDYNTQIQLTAIPEPGYKLASWSGGLCNGDLLECDFLIIEDSLIQATFVIDDVLFANSFESP